jgi:hypothetical protein
MKSLFSIKGAHNGNYKFSYLLLLFFITSIALQFTLFSIINNVRVHCVTFAFHNLWHLVGVIMS